MRERRLIDRIRSGDAAAGEELVRQHYPRIYRFLEAVVGDAEVVRDLAQQTFVRAWAALPMFRHECTLSTWLHRIAHREYAQWLRSRRPHLTLEAAAELPDARTARSLEAVLVRRALARLTEEHRTTLVLHYVQGLTVEQVSAVLEIPAGTVKSRLFHGRQRLHELLRDTEEKRECRAHVAV